MDMTVPDQLWGLPVPVLFFGAWGIGVFFALMGINNYYRKRTQRNFVPKDRKK